MDEITNKITWTEAKTYAAYAPHEYIVEEQSPEAFEYFKKLIDAEGVDELFTMPARGDKPAYTLPYRYYYHEGYKYWCMDNILNRAKL